MKAFALFALFVSSAAALAGNTTVSDEGIAPICWKGAKGRGVGKPISTCHGANPDRAGALCYPACRDGYVGRGPVCWQRCEEGWVNEGALCRKKGSIKTRAKKSYGRTAGVPLMCAEGLENDAGLCYKPCPSGMAGNGPVCWERCPAVDPVNGGALCCRDGSTCSAKIRGLASKIPIDVVKAVLSGYAGDMDEVIKEAVLGLKDALGFVMPKCGSLEVSGEGEEASL